MPEVTDALFVAWQHRGSRRFYPVARLTRAGGESCEGCYEFAYIRGAHEAGAVGFEPFLAFPELERTYRSREMFPLFANRLMSPNRLDYPAYIARLGLERGADPLTVLARSGGGRATDAVELFPLPKPDEDLGGYTTPFFVHAVRHFPPASQERIESLRPGERLFLMADCQNPVDPAAIALRTADQVLIGYLPRYLLADAHRLCDECEFFEVMVERVNSRPAPVQQRVLCRLEACWPPDFVPFASDRYQPLAGDAAVITPAPLMIA